MSWKPSRSSELGPAVRQALESLYKKIANVFTDTEDGLVPASGGGTKFLRSDGTWQTIGGGGDLLSTNNLSDLANAATARANLGLGSASTTSSAAYDPAGSAAAAQAAAIAASQPLDTDLSAIAALVSAADQLPYATGAGTWSMTTVTGTARSMLAETSKPNLRAFLGLSIGSDVQAYDAELAALAGLTSAADTLPYFTGSGTAALATFTGAARTLLDDATVADMRTTLGLTIGTNVQAYDAELAAIAGLTSAADRLPYFTGSGTAALATFTAAGRALVDDANAAAQRTTLGLVIGTNVQAYSANLTTLASASGVVLTDAAQTIANATITDVTWGTEVSDPDGWTSGGSATLTVPAGKAGRYALYYRGVWSADPTASVGTFIIGGAAEAPTSHNSWNAANYMICMNIACRTLAAGDTIKVSVYQASGSNKDIVSRLEIVYLGP